jgi:hypothetical protein
MSTTSRRLLIPLVLGLLLTVVAAQPPAGAQIISDTIPLGKEGGGVAVDVATNRLYVAVLGQIKVYDATTHAPITTIPLPQNYSACYDLAVNPATNRIYAAGFRTYVVDGNSNTVLANLDVPTNEVVVNPTTNRVYLADIVNYPYTSPYVVRVLDGATNTWLPDIQVGTINTYASIHLAVNPASNRIYITFTNDNQLRVLDGANHAELKRVTLESIGYVVVHPGDGRVFVGTKYRDVAILDGTTHAPLGTITRLGGQLALNPLTNRLYAVDSLNPGYVLRVADVDAGVVVGYDYLDGDWEDFAVHPALGKVFGTHAGSPASWGKKLSVVQDATPTQPAPRPTPPCEIATVDLPQAGDGVGVNAVTNRLYVGVDGGVAVYDAESLTSLSFIDLSSTSYEPPIYDVGVDEARDRIYAVGVGETWAIDGVSHQILTKWAGGNEIAVNPSNGRVYITSDAVWLNVPDRLRIYDGAGLTHIRTLDLGTSSHFQSSHIAVNQNTGYAYSTYSLDDDLRIISPTTDDVAQTIDYASIGTVTVNPATNRIYVWISRTGQSGALMLDGNTHAELGMITGVSGHLQVNPATGRLYGATGGTLFQIFDATVGGSLGQVFLDGGMRGYAVHPELSRLYVTRVDSPVGWAKKLSVIQDSGMPLPQRATLPLVVRQR